MPTIKILDSVKIDIYSREHPPPHFHVIYAEHEELLDIQTLETLKGSVPAKQRKKVIDWAMNKKEFLIANFKRLNPGL